jgi:opacity protein-like surface antigen
MHSVRNKLAITFLLLCTQIAWAQKDDCEQTLTNALEEFNAGHFYGLSAMLKPCIDNGFTLEQKQRAYLLLTQTYLLIDDPIAAEDSYLKLLKANPEFATDESRDPIDVVYLSKKFTSSPVFSLYGRIGGNISIPRVIHDITLFDGPNGKDLKEKYSVEPGFQVNIGGEWHYNDNISLVAGLQYMYTSYRHVTSGIFGRDVLDFQDKLSWLNIPLMVKYSFQNKGKFKPYAYAGYSTNFLIGDKGVIKYKNGEPALTSENETINSVTSPDINLRYQRNTTNNAFIVGGGIRRKIGLNYWFVDLRYSFGLRNIVNEKNHYADNTNSQKYQQSLVPLMLYQQTEDYFRLDNLSISVGYIHPLYKPRKLKNARTKSVLKKLNSEQ